MPIEGVQRMRAELAQLVNQGKTLHAELEAKRTRGESIDKTESDKLNKLIEDGQAKRAELDRLESLDALDKYTSDPEGRKTLETPPVAGSDGPAAKPFTFKSPGRQFVDSKVFEKLTRGEAEKVSISVPQLPIGVHGGIKAILGETALSGGETIRADRLTEILDIARQRPPSVIDLVNRSETSLNSVEYVKLTGRTDNTAIVAEAAAKPEGDLAFDVDSAAVKVIAQWIKASRQIIDDAPRLRNTIDNELTYMVELKLENVIIADMLAASGIQTRVHQVSGRGFLADDSIADTLRRAMTDIRLEFYEADGVVLHPTQAEAMELDKAADGHYVNVYDPVAQRVWRKPVVETPAMTSGTGAVANYRLAYTLWDRMQARVEVGYVNDDFIKNLITILGELRAAYAMVRPKAFEKITGM